jgi:hypothetical protein
MGQISRMHTGPVTVPDRFLDELDWLLSMDSAAGRDVIAPLADEVRARIEAGDDPAEDAEFVARVNKIHVHPYLRLCEVDAVQRLSESQIDIGNGTGVTVEAHWLGEVRNVLDSLVHTWAGCEDYAEELTPGSDEFVLVNRALDRGEKCFRCGVCQFTAMADRIDAFLDEQGYVGDAYYRYWVAEFQVEHPEDVWRKRIMGDLESAFTAA